MAQNFRRFQTGADPRGRAWDVEFRWQQNGISIRHADTVDVKFDIRTEGVAKQEKVIALQQPHLLKLSDAGGRAVSDAWCMKLAALHLKHMVETGVGVDQTLVTPSYAELAEYAGSLA
jgi:hypothetical protein